MSTRPCALPSSHRRSPFLERTFFLLIFCATLFLPYSARSDEQIIVTITLNQERKGDFFVFLREDGDFLVRIADLQEVGFSQFPNERIEIGGSPHVSLNALQKVGFFFDESTLTLELTAAPELLPRSAIDLSASRRAGVIYPRDRSFFLNYGLDYSAQGNEFEGFTASNEFGLRFRDLLLLSDSLYTESPTDSLFVRLNTSLTWDDRQSLRRVIAGDFFASSGNLGNRVQLGGLSLAKVYRIDPYLIRYPLFDFVGQTPLPSDVEIYVDGAQVRSQRFAPGEFELRNLQGFGGARTVEVVIRDSLGREQRIVSPFYFTDQILRRGLHEYSYNLGLLRRDFGRESNHYSDLAFTAFHRYGLSDQVNVGVRGESGNDLLNLGIETAFKTGGFGLVRLEGATSQSSEGTGMAGLLSYEYQNRTFRALLAIQGFSEEYRTLADSAQPRKLNMRAGIGYGTPRLGSLSFDYFLTETFGESDQETWAVSWSRRVWERTFANVSLRRVRENEISHEMGITLTWYFGRDHSLSGSIRREGGADIQAFETRRNTPAGEGTGWSIRGERSARGANETYLLNPVVQHNARQGVLRGDFTLGRSETSDTEDVRLSVAGALVHVGGTFALTRPVTDSFALVSVGAAEGVRVYVNGQNAGKTDRRGQAILPDLSSYYENQITIEDKDIPLDYLMPKVRLDVSPPLRSGSCLNFPLRRYQAFTGTLIVEERLVKKPLAHAELNLAAPGGEVTFWTGSNGEFYFDTQEAAYELDSFQGCDFLEKPVGSFLPPGIYRLTIRHQEEIFHSEIAIPASDGAFTDLGEFTLSTLPPDSKSPQAGLLRN